MAQTLSQKKRSSNSSPVCLSISVWSSLPFWLPRPSPSSRFARSAWTVVCLFHSEVRCSSIGVWWFLDLALQSRPDSPSVSRSHSNLYLLSSCLVHLEFLRVNHGWVRSFWKFVCTLSLVERLGVSVIQAPSPHHSSQPFGLLCALGGIKDRMVAGKEACGWILYMTPWSAFGYLLSWVDG